jgi:hypothetical protein
MRHGPDNVKIMEDPAGTVPAGSSIIFPAATDLVAGPRRRRPSPTQQCRYAGSLEMRRFNILHGEITKLRTVIETLPDEMEEIRER